MRNLLIFLLCITISLTAADKLPDGFHVIYTPSSPVKQYVVEYADGSMILPDGNVTQANPKKDTAP